MSKELEALEALKQLCELAGWGVISSQEIKRCAAIEKYRPIIEKPLKALKIIKEKEVNVRDFMNVCSKMPYEHYFYMWKDGHFLGVKLTSKVMLTQEEYSVLQEVF